MPIIPCFMGVYGNKSYGPVHCCPVESNSKCGIKCGINLMAAHTVNKLTAIFVKKAKEPGKYGDGNGLFLHVKLSGAKHWVQRLMPANAFSCWASPATACICFAHYSYPSNGPAPAT